jgi:hypothetical protein
MVKTTLNEGVYSKLLENMCKCESTSILTLNSCKIHAFVSQQREKCESVTTNHLLNPPMRQKLNVEAVGKMRLIDRS